MNIYLQRILFHVALLAILTAWGCMPPPPPPPAVPPTPPPEAAPPSVEAEKALEQISWSSVTDALPADAQGLSAWASALERSAAYYAKRSSGDPVRFGPDLVSAGAMAQGCRDLAQVAAAGDVSRLREHLANNYRLYRSVGNDGAGAILVTGYYEPELRGSRTRTERYRYPIYRQPDDILEADLGQWSKDLKGRTIRARVDRGKLIPYYDRNDIDYRNKLASRDLEIVWVDDPVDLFFLHIQGSGRVKLDNGETVRVGYHSANGREYRSIGTLLIQEKRVPKESMSMPALRQWLRENHRERERVFNHNPSYVFFKEQEGGPFGNIQVALTGFRSIATDHRLMPKGAPAILQTELPELNGDGVPRSWYKVTRLVVNQDTGGAIKGPGRVDYFTGFGPEAEQTAGVLKNPGALYFIAPKAGAVSAKK